MQIFGPGGCVELLEQEFKIIYPIFSRRLDFFKHNQELGEESSAFLHRILTMGDMADLENLTMEDLKAFRFIAGCNDKKLREKLFQLKRRDLTTIKEVVSQHEMELKAENALTKTAPITAVNWALSGTGNPGPSGPTTGQQQQQHQHGSQRQNKQPFPKQLKDKCTSCGKSSHKSAECHIRQNKIVCDHCGKSGHLAKVCYAALCAKANKDQDNKATKKPVRKVAKDHDSEASGLEEEVWQHLPLWIKHGKRSFHFHTFPDTGSATTLISSNVAKQEQMEVIKEAPNCKFVSVNGDAVPTDGMVPISLSTNSHSADTKAIVSPAVKDDMIVSRDDLKRLRVIPNRFPEPINIISQEQFDKYNALRLNLIQTNPNVLTDELHSESMEGCVMKIHLTPGEKQPNRISTARQVPLHWREKAEKVIDKLISEHVITCQDEPTDWCVPVFFVIKKNGNLRFVVDFTHLNKCVCHPVHTFRSTQEILSGLDPKSKVFPNLAATQGYHQVPLEENSSKLTTFLLPSRRFHFLRAPMGLSCSSDKFCRRSNQVVEGIQGVRKLVDDILIQAPGMPTLEKRNSLLQRCKTYNFTLSRRKLEIGESVEFWAKSWAGKGCNQTPDSCRVSETFHHQKLSRS